MESLGLSTDDLNPPATFDSRRALARAQSAQIMSKKFIQRDRVKNQMMEEEVCGKFYQFWLPAETYTCIDPTSTTKDDASQEEGEHVDPEDAELSVQGQSGRRE